MARTVNITLVGLALLSLVLCGVWTLVDSASIAGAQDLDCRTNFQFQEDAQAVLDQDPSDPNGLDRGKNGVACQDLPHRPSGGAASGESFPKVVLNSGGPKT